jgi:hypothetical protein
VTGRSRDEYTVGHYALSHLSRATQGRWAILVVGSYRPDVSTAHNKSESVIRALDALDDGVDPDRAVLRDAVRALLTELALRVPGRSVEVRVPPFGAIQCVEGPRHTRGTPANVVETDPLTWLLVATGRLPWAEAVASGRVRASGTRTDMSAYLPIHRDPPDGA